MAKALLGYMGGTDPRPARDIALLRRRISDLEGLVARLQRDNDELTAALRERDLMLASPLNSELSTELRSELTPESAEHLLEPALH